MSYHSENKNSVGLGNVDNTSDANKPVSTAQQTALDLKSPIASPTFTGTVGGITKSMVGLGNADNTSDANKPVSTAQAAAIAAVNPYLSYQAIISQSGTSAPSATVYKNDFGATTFTWARTLAGIYTCTASSAVFTGSKTVILLSQPLASLVTYIVVPTSTSVITLTTLLTSIIATVLTATATDVLLTNTLVEIRVYP